MRTALRRGFQVVIVIGLFGLLLFAVFPTRTYLSQRESTDRARERLSVLEAETEQLRERAAGLDSDEEIERLAREDHGLVKPGEELYPVLRAPLPPVDLPDMWLAGDPDGEPGAPAEIQVEVVDLEPTEG